MRPHQGKGLQAGRHGPNLAEPDVERPRNHRGHRPHRRHPGPSGVQGTTGCLALGRASGFAGGSTTSQDLLKTSLPNPPARNDQADDYRY